VIRKFLALAFLAAGPAGANVAVTGPADAPTFIFTTQLHFLTGEVVSPRGRRERLLLDITTVTRETLNEKGIEGQASTSLRVLRTEQCRWSTPSVCWDGRRRLTTLV
jgi:hypothetical protein